MYIYLYMYIYMYMHIHVHAYIHLHMHIKEYGVATISRLLEIIGLFCKRAL